MSHVTHHAIVVTTWNKARAVAAQAAARRIFGDDLVTPFASAIVNEYHTFLVGSDGSKEGWNESNHGDDQRDAFVAWLKAQRDDEGGWLLDWFEVKYGEDNLQDGHEGPIAPRVTRGSR